MPMDDHVRTMLTLAGLTYRGFYLGRVPGVKAALLEKVVHDGLEAWADSWKLAWGPTTSHMLGDRYDSSAMFAVHARSDPSRWVIAVRGTNPISIQDWLFGDFDVSRTVAWPFGGQAGGVSMSTALGLHQLRALAWMPAAHPSFLAAVLPSIDLPHIPDGLLDLARQSDLAEWARHRIEEALVGVLAKGADDAQLTALVERICTRHDRADVDLGWKDPTAHGLVGVLAKTASDAAKPGAKPLDVVVTGHSKGGAVAPAFALWLSDTRRLPGGGGWDPQKLSTIRYAAFAGPTPGDAVFAARAAKEVGTGSCRVVNTNDIVPHAWEADGMGAVAKLYDGRLSHLADMLREVNDRLTTNGAVYKHIGVPTLEFAGRLHGGSVGMEAIHQHLDAYLDEAGLRSRAIDLFLG
jgi:hypothetical protein